jgi:hypothetical protein
MDGIDPKVLQTGFEGVSAAKRGRNFSSRAGRADAACRLPPPTELPPTPSLLLLMDGLAAPVLQRFFGASWNDVGEDNAVATPTLVPLALRPHSIPLAVLAIGFESGYVISEHGNELASFHVAFPPVAPAVVADFDGDGLNDIIVVTRGGVFGYSQVQHLGGLSFGALLLTLIVAMGIVWYSQQYDSGMMGAAASAMPGMMPGAVGIGGLAGAQGQAARSRKLRSTEYVD